MCAFFVFKQKTAYEMRISDWSSDVCSSDRHQPQIGERLHRLADRGPPDAETRHQLALGRQAFARAAFAADDHRLQPVEDFVGQLASDDGFVFGWRSEEHTSELQSLMRISYAVFCLKKKNTRT